MTNKQKEIKSSLKSNPQTREILTNQEYKPSIPNKKGGNFFPRWPKGKLLFCGLAMVGIIAIIIALIAWATGWNKD